VFPFLRAWFDWRFERLEEIPPTGPVLIACNHASYLDPLVNAYAVVRANRRPAAKLVSVPVPSRQRRKSATTRDSGWFAWLS